MRLGEIQKALHVPKGNHNSFGGYSYRSASDILEAVKKVLKEDEYICCDDALMLIGDRYYVKAIATITGPDWAVTCTGYARESFDKKGMDTSQITGAASSYARKYALCGLLAIDDTPDADTMDNSESETAALAARVKDHLMNGDEDTVYEVVKHLSNEEKKAMTKYLAPDIVKAIKDIMHAKT